MRVSCAHVCHVCPVRMCVMCAVCVCVSCDCVFILCGYVVLGCVLYMVHVHMRCGRLHLVSRVCAHAPWGAWYALWSHVHRLRWAMRACTAGPCAQGGSGICAGWFVAYGHVLQEVIFCGGVGPCAVRGTMCVCACSPYLLQPHIYRLLTLLVAAMYIQGLSSVLAPACMHICILST